MRAMITQGSTAAWPSGRTDMVRLTLDSASPPITGTTLTKVMGITGIPAGRYAFTILLVHQTTATGTGIDTAVLVGGTPSKYIAEARFSTTATGTISAAASEASTNATGNMYNGQSTRFNGSRIGTGSQSVDAADTNMLMTIEGMFILTKAGDLELQMAAEGITLVCSARAGSSIELRRFS